MLLQIVLTLESSEEKNAERKDKIQHNAMLMAYSMINLNWFEFYCYYEEPVRLTSRREYAPDANFRAAPRGVGWNE